MAMEYSYFHWAFHPWAIYAIVGLALAYFVYRKGERNLISSAFRPLLGNRVDGPLGRGIDSLAIFATLFGSATSLGLGALQINGGMDILWGVENSNGVAVLIIAVLTAAFILSAVSGVAKGVQYLSNMNMGLAGHAAAVPAVRRPDGLHLRHADRGGRRLPHQHRPQLVRHRRVRGPRVARRVDDLLLGVVDLVGAVRRHVHRAHLARAHDRAVRVRRAADPDAA